MTLIKVYFKSIKLIGDKNISYVTPDVGCTSTDKVLVLLDYPGVTD